MKSGLIRRMAFGGRGFIKQGTTVSLHHPYANSYNMKGDCIFMK